MKYTKLLLIFFFIFGSFTGFAQQKGSPFASDIRRFKQLDFAIPPKTNAILFYGSSSFTKWTDVQQYFPDYDIINRSFGGSCLTDLIMHANEIVFPYHPRQIVIYCGENDFAVSDTISANNVTERFIKLFKLIRAKLPDVQISYISMKPSPSRWNLADKFVTSNQQIRDFLDSQVNTSYINIWDKMLNKNNLPDSALFVDDWLHMNAEGYKIWQKEINPRLIK
jgi:lysophospholipase L1-like esterase